MSCKDLLRGQVPLDHAFLDALQSGSCFSLIRSPWILGVQEISQLMETDFWSLVLFYEIPLKCLNLIALQLVSFLLEEGSHFTCAEHSILVFVQFLEQGSHVDVQFLDLCCQWLDQIFHGDRETFLRDCSIKGLHEFFLEDHALVVPVKVLI